MKSTKEKKLKLAPNTDSWRHRKETQMKYKVTLKVSYLRTEFLFSDRQEALDFMETAWMNRKDGKDMITEAVLTFEEDEPVEEEA